MNQRRLGLSAYPSFVLLPEVIDRLNQEAPYMKLIAHHLNYFSDASKLENGELDIEYPLIMVSFNNDPADTYLDRLIRTEGLDAKVKVVVPHALIALLALKKNNYITHTVKRLAEPMLKQLELKFLPTPTEVKKVHEEPYVAHQYWYKTSSDDEAHQWIRALIKEVSGEK